MTYPKRTQRIAEIEREIRARLRLGSKPEELRREFSWPVVSRQARLIAGPKPEVVPVDMEMIQ